MEPGLLSHPVRLAGASLLRLQSDARLTALARTGHDEAFAAIVQRYRPALLRYCTRILGPERAEDAVQQALLNAHTALMSADDRPIELRPWLYRISHNAALNVLRGRRDEPELSADAAAAAESLDEVVDRRERLQAVLAAIAALPPAQRDALLLRELEGRSHQEIADVLGVSAGAARQQLFRARTAIRAACTAITPLPLLTRLFELGGVASAGGGDVAAGVAAKAVAGVLATTALVGGATTAGLVHRDRHDGAVARAATAETATAPPRRAPAAPSAAASAALTTTTGASARSEPGTHAGGREDHRRGRGDDRRGRDDEGHGRGDGDGHGSDDRGPDRSGAAPTQMVAAGADDHGSGGHGSDDRGETDDHGGDRDGRSGRDDASGHDGGGGRREDRSSSPPVVTVDDDRAGRSGSGSGKSGSGRDDDRPTGTTTTQAAGDDDAAPVVTAPAARDDGSGGEDSGGGRDGGSGSDD